MPPTNKTRQLIEFKGTTLPVVVVTLRSLHPDALAEAASALFGDDEFFDGDAALLELSQIVDVPEPDWRRVKQVLKSHGLNVIGVRGGSEELRYGARLRRLADLCCWRTFIPPATACQATPSPLPAKQRPDQCSGTPTDSEPPSHRRANGLH
jgi:septum site-determining protein MinC